jgi:hypothetical protein
MDLKNIKTTQESPIRTFKNLHLSDLLSIMTKGCNEEKISDMCDEIWNSQITYCVHMILYLNYIWIFLEFGYWDCNYLWHILTKDYVDIDGCTYDISGSVDERLSMINDAASYFILDDSCFNHQYLYTRKCLLSYTDDAKIIDDSKHEMIARRVESTVMWCRLNSDLSNPDWATLYCNCRKCRKTRHDVIDAIRCFKTPPYAIRVIHVRDHKFMEFTCKKYYNTRFQDEIDACSPLVPVMKGDKNHRGYLYLIWNNHGQYDPWRSRRDLTCRDSRKSNV